MRLGMYMTDTDGIKFKLHNFSHPMKGMFTVNFTPRPNAGVSHTQACTYICIQANL